MTIILYNPLSGNGNGKTRAEALAGTIEGAELLDMTTLNGYEALFGRLTEDDRVVLCGGDGTINRFINDSAGLTLRAKLDYFAAGSGNDFLADVSRFYGEPTDKPFDLKPYLADLPVVTARTSNGKETKPQRFLNGIGYGIDGYCCEVGDRLREQSDKPVDYAGIAIKGILFHYKATAADVTVDGQSFHYDKVWLAPTMKGRFYGGGMMITPDQDRKSGELSVGVFHTSGILKTLCVFPSIFKGEHLKHTELFTVYTGKSVTVAFDRPVAMQIDGETVLNVVECRMEARAAVKA